MARLVIRSRVVSVAIGVMGMLAGAGTAEGQRPDSTAVDTLTYLLEPIAVAVERERSAPPPVGAVTITPVALRRTQGADIYQSIRKVSGLEIHDQGQGPGYASNVVMRGFTSDHSSDVLLVIDGVPVNLPAHGHVEGYADWNVLMPSSVSSFRVLHGNSSPLYGDFALAGAVEVFTRADATGADASLSGSSFGDAQATLSFGTRSDAAGSFIAAEGRRGRGWRAGSESWLANGLVRGWRATGGGRLEGGVGVYATGWDSPGFLSVPAFNARAFQDRTDETDGGYSRRAVVHGRFARPVGARGYVQAVGWGMASEYGLFLNIPGHDHGGAFGVLQQSGEWDQRLGVGGQLEGGWTRPGGDVLFGLSARLDHADYDHALTIFRDVVDREISLDARHWSSAAYTRWRFPVTDRLALDLGGRADFVGHRSSSRLDDGVAPTSSVNVVLSPKVGTRFHIRGPWFAVGTSARGFRSAVGIIGDPGREPYISWSHELGLEREGGDWTVHASAFRVSVDNERVFDPVTLLSTGAGSSVREGADLRFTTTLPWGLSTSLGGTWNHARLSAPYADAHEDHPHGVFDAPDPNLSTPGDSALANRVPGLAEYIGQFSLSAPVRPDLDARVAFRFAGPHVPIGEPTVQTRSYSVLDLGTSWAFGPGRSLDVELENVLGVRYVELRSSSYVTPGAPRSLRAQVRIEGM